jgi:hypothetical protein
MLPANRRGTSGGEDEFNGRALPRTGSQVIEQMEHVSRPYLSQTPAIHPTMEWSQAIAQARILPPKPCSVCSTAPSAAPMADFEVTSC